MVLALQHGTNGATNVLLTVLGLVAILFIVLGALKLAGVQAARNLSAWGCIGAGVVLGILWLIL